MKIDIKIPDELAAQAHARGMALEAYVEQILMEQVKESKAGNPAVRSPEEVRRWLDSLAQFSDKIPTLPENISRDWIYQDHD